MSAEYSLVDLRPPVGVVREERGDFDLLHAVHEQLQEIIELTQQGVRVDKGDGEGLDWLRELFFLQTPSRVQDPLELGLNNVVIELQQVLEACECILDHRHRFDRCNKSDYDAPSKTTLTSGVLLDRQKLRETVAEIEEELILVSVLCVERNAVHVEVNDRVQQRVHRRNRQGSIDRSVGVFVH